MNDLFSYIEEFASIDFNQMKLTEVDNVIFSRLAYLDFGAFAGKTIEYAAGEYSVDEGAPKNITKTYELLCALAATHRFKNVYIKSSKEIVSEDNSEVFYGVSFRLTDDTIFIAFRGTDDKIMSFYEDAELAYSFPISSQISALAFVNEELASCSNRAYIGGHSKGGNLALFSYAFLIDNEKERIIKAYNNDGPGFPKELVKIIFKPSDNEKIINLAPQDSIVGRMLEAGGEYTVVESSAFGVKQHNVFSWVVDGNAFKAVKKFSFFSQYIEDSLTLGLDTISPEEIKKAAERIYSIAVKSNIKSTKDFGNITYKNILLALLEIEKREEKAGNEILSVVKTLIKSLFDTADFKKFFEYNIPAELLEYRNMSKEDIKNQLTERLKLMLAGKDTDE